MQKGSLVAPDRLRFDFSHMKPITNEELEIIDKLVNEYVSNSSEVTTRIMTPKAAIEKGALAFLSLIHISEPTRPVTISYAVFC